MSMWSPWDGCYAAADGCEYCYYYGKHSKRYWKNEIIRAGENEFHAPLDKQKNKIGDIVYTCFSSDFFIPEADEWREEAWSVIKQRPDLIFRFLTKRIDRFHVSLPNDWGGGYDNVEIGCGVENQETADYRLPLFLSYPIKNKWIQCTPLIGETDLSPYLRGVSGVSVGGEWGMEARELDYDWVLAIREQCMRAGISFQFRQTGQRFRKDGVLHKISPFRKKQALKDLGIDNINIYIKSDIEKILAEKKIDIYPEPDKTFLMAFDKAISELGYGFGSVLGSGTAQDPLIINYTKTGAGISPAARVYIEESGVAVWLFLKKITPRFKYIETAPANIKEIFTGHHDNCASCAKKCRTRDKYAIDGRFIQKCNPTRYLEPSVDKLPDYMNLLLEFFPDN